MATPWQLVPVSWLKQHTIARSEPVLPQSSPAQTFTSNIQVAQFDELDEQESRPRTDFESVIDILPKRYVNRGKALVQFVQLAGCKLDFHRRLVYPDGSIGSSFYELLTFALTPPHIRKGRPRPLDYPKFVKLLETVQAPEYLYDRGQTSQTLTPAIQKRSKPTTRSKAVTRRKRRR